MTFVTNTCTEEKDGEEEEEEPAPPAAPSFTSQRGHPNSETFFGKHRLGLRNGVKHKRLC